jgi:hypothetical protein
MPGYIRDCSVATRSHDEFDRRLCSGLPVSTSRKVSDVVAVAANQRQERVFIVVAIARAGIMNKDGTHVGSS